MAPRQFVTLAQIQQQVINRLGNGVFWTTAIASGSAQSELTFLINEAIRTWQAYTGYWKNRITITTIAQLPYYDLPRSISMGMRVTFNGSPLILGDVFSWDQGYPGWEGIPGTPSEWAPVGVNIIATRPVDFVGDNSIVVDGIQAAPTLTKSTDFIDIGQEQFNSLLGYVEHIASFKEGGQEFQATMPLYKAFLESAMIQNERLRANAKFRSMLGASEEDQRKPRRVKDAELAPVGER